MTRNISETAQTHGVTHKISHNNLHIRCSTFDQSQASTVMGLMRAFHRNCERIFIDVRDIPSPRSSVVNSFRTELSNCPIAPRQIFFKGSEGFNLAINGNRVLVHTDKGHPKPEGHTCCGRCAHCHCHDHDHDHDHDD